MSENEACLNCNGTGYYMLDGARRPCLWDHSKPEPQRCTAEDWSRLTCEWVRCDEAAVEAGECGEHRAITLAVARMEAR